MYHEKEEAVRDKCITFEITTQFTLFHDTFIICRLCFKKQD